MRARGESCNTAEHGRPLPCIRSHLSAAGCGVRRRGNGRPSWASQKAGGPVGNQQESLPRQPRQAHACGPPPRPHHPPTRAAMPYRPSAATITSSSPSTYALAPRPSCIEGQAQLPASLSALVRRRCRASAPFPHPPPPTPPFHPRAPRTTRLSQVQYGVQHHLPGAVVRRLAAAGGAGHLGAQRQQRVRLCAEVLGPAALAHGVDVRVLRSWVGRRGQGRG